MATNSPSSSTTIHVPVLIIGGGIVGLSASLFLSHMGIRSLLVERHSGTSIHPRSRTLNARSMELYRGLGIDEAICAAGAETNAGWGMSKGSSVREVIGAQKRSKEAEEDENKGGKVPGGGWLFSAISPTATARGTQDVIEPVLLKEARSKKEAEVRFYTECTGFEEDGDEVRATIVDRGSGEKATVHAKYLIGADGANGRVRQSLGLKSTGPGVLGHLVNVLVEVDLRDFVRGREFSMCLVERPDVRGLFTSINNRDVWVCHISYDPEKGEKQEDFTFARCEELIKIILGMPDVKVKIKSVLPWDSTVQVVETLQKGRIFLAGDAAHQMPPWRGQGANSGIAEVHNLAWKIAAVLNGQATPALLETYNSERLPVARFAAEQSGAAADEHGLIAISPLTMIKVVRMGGMIFGYGYDYTTQATVPDTTSPLIPRIPWFFWAWMFGMNGKPGTRVPHLWVERANQKISTLDLCNRSWTLLAGSDGGAWRDAAKQMRNIDLTAYTLGPKGDLVDQKCQWEHIAGISAKGALLVRPDGFVAWRAYNLPEKVEESLARVMKQVLCR